MPIRQIRKLQPQRSKRVASVRFNARQRLLSFRDPTRGMFKTHDLPTANGVIATSTLFPGDSRNRPITISISFSGTTGSSQFIIGDGLGAGDISLLFFISGTTIIATAGQFSASNFGVTLLPSTPLKAGKNHKLVLAADPGSGRAQLWLDGVSIAKGQAANGPFSPLEWAGTGDGLVSIDPSSVLQKASAYVGQLPRQFNF